MTEAERQALSKRMLDDAKFRAQVLKDPAAAAAQMNLVLSDKEIRGILKNAAKLKARGKKFDAATKEIANIELKMILPFFGISRR